MSRYAKATKPPREGTRVRAVFDYLRANPNAATWSCAKIAYDYADPVLSRFSRNYTGMELSRILKRYTTKVSRGVYKLDDRWEHYFRDNGQIACTCGKHDWHTSRTTRTSLQGFWPTGYPDLDNELHYVDGRACKCWKGAADEVKVENVNPLKNFVEKLQVPVKPEKTSDDEVDENRKCEAGCGCSGDDSVLGVLNNALRRTVEMSEDCDLNSRQESYLTDIRNEIHLAIRKLGS